MDVPSGLGETGAAIYLAKAVDVSDPAALALIKEAARCADRLDELDNIIQGKGVLELMKFRVNAIEDTDDDRNINVEVYFAAPLAEARQQQLRLTTLLQAVNVIAPAVVAPTGAVVEPDKPQSTLSELDAIRARRAAARGK